MRIRALHTPAAMSAVPMAMGWMRSAGGELKERSRKRFLSGLGKLILIT